MLKSVAALTTSRQLVFHIFTEGEELFSLFQREVCDGFKLSAFHLETVT